MPPPGPEKLLSCLTSNSSAWSTAQQSPKVRKAMKSNTSFQSMPLLGPEKLMSLCKVTRPRPTPLLGPERLMKLWKVLESPVHASTGPREVSEFVRSTSSLQSMHLVGPERLMSLWKVILVSGLRRYWAQRSSWIYGKELQSPIYALTGPRETNESMQGNSNFRFAPPLGPEKLLGLWKEAQSPVYACSGPRECSAYNGQ